ncbi:MAG: hypothetical protein CVU65_06890 [Deltaproteobacteria bacterium HGW-Deltaproteobacteria-22]|nr:MAG: hypothetical protein CVU65_06890 [Deltaproteobacteria bacterium HGW-Deltaproteobacteria-22]
MIHLIFSLLLSGTSFLPVPVVSDFHSTVKNVKSALNDYLEAWDPETPKRLVVSQKEQKLYLFHQNTLLAVFAVSTGRNGYTPDGVYRIYYKKAMVRYREGDGMPFWMEFKPKFGFHGLPFDKDGVPYGAEELGKPASAGCVRLETVNAGLLYQVTPSHSLVVIQQDPPSY